MQNFFSINRINLLMFYLIAVLPFAGFLAKGVNIGGLMTLFMIPMVFLVFILRPTIHFPRYLIYWLLFTVYQALSNIFLASKDVNLKFFYADDFFGSLLYLFILENLVIPKQDYKNFYKISLVVLGIAFLVISAQQFVNPYFFAPSDTALQLMPDEERRLPSIYGWIGASSLLGVCFFPVLGIYIEDSFRKSSKPLFVLVLFIAGALVSLFNKSRFVMLNFMLLLFLIPIYKGFKLNTVVRYTAIVLVSVFIIYFGSKAINYDIDKLISERITESDKGGLKNGSAATRLVAFEVFGKLFPKRPLWGRGYLHGFGPRGSRDFELVKAIAGRSSQIHVGYLSLFYYYGLVGGGIYVLFLISFTRKLYKDAKFHGHWSPFLGWSMFLVSNLTLVMLDVNIMGLIIIFLFNQYYIQEAENNLKEVQAATQ